MHASTSIARDCTRGDLIEMQVCSDALSVPQPLLQQPTKSHTRSATLRVDEPVHPDKEDRVQAHHAALLYQLQTNKYVLL